MSKKIPSLLTDNKLLIKLAGIPERIRWIGLFVILGGIVLIWGAFFYIPLVWRMRNDSAQVVEEESVQIVLARQAKRGVLLKKENNEMRHFLKNSVVPQSYQIADSLVTLADKSGIVCSSIVPVEKDLSIGLKGAFSGVLSFLDHLQQEKSAASIKKFTCYRTDDNQVRATLILQVMRRLP